MGNSNRDEVQRVSRHGAQAMKVFRRNAVIALSVMLLGAGIAWIVARPDSGLGVTREPLGNFDPKTRSLIAGAERVVFLIPFSHWDTDWHDSFESYSRQADANILKAIEIAKQDPRYRYTLEQVLFVQHFWETHPDSRADLLRLVRDRQLTFAWGGITQPETSLVAPSIQVRNLKLGQAWIAETFGEEFVPRTAWQSDAFGNSAAFPTFLNQSNIPYLFIGRNQGRCDPDFEDCTPLPPAFYWSSPASAENRVLVAYISYPTAWGNIYLKEDPDAQVAALRKTIDENFSRTDSKYLFLPIGFDFFDPRPSLPDFIESWNAADPHTVLVISDPDSAFQNLANEPLPEITVDMNPIWQAFYNTRPFAKIADKETEYYLTSADKFGLLIDAPGSAAWDLAAFNTHYDNISGVSFDWVWEQSQRPRYEQTLALAKDDLANILAQISARVPAPVVIFNPTSWSRSQVVELNGQLPDVGDLPVPVQQIDADTVAFYAENVSSLGYVGLSNGDVSVPNPVTLMQNRDQITLANGLVTVTLDAGRGGAFSSMRLFSAAGEQELLAGIGDDVTYWADTGDVYGARFGDVIARESEVTAELTALASGPLLARVQAIFTLGGQQIIKTVTLRADEPIVEVDLQLRALPDSIAIVQTSSILDTNMRTDDLGFGAFTHAIDTRPIASGDVTYRREIFYPIVYWSDVSRDDVGLTLITHGLQGVSGGAMRGVMLVRQATGDEEGVTDPGVHDLRYAYFLHNGNAIAAEAWRHAYEFNQPLLLTWKTGQKVNVGLPFDEQLENREFDNLSSSPALPGTYSMLSADGVVVADIYHHGGHTEALILNYDPSRGGGIDTGVRQINLSQHVFEVLQFPVGALQLPLP